MRLRGLSLSSRLTELTVAHDFAEVFPSFDEAAELSCKIKLSLE
jgi:hypothetical protein